MLKKINVLLMMMAIAGLTLGFSGCGKDTADTEQGGSQLEGSGTTPQPDVEEPVAGVKEEPVVVEEPVKEEPVEVETENPVEIEEPTNIVAVVEAKPEEKPVPAGMELFKPEIPNPAFRGTPRNSVIENLDKTAPVPPQFYAPKGTKNLALGKTVSASEEYCSTGEIDMITDGDKMGTDETYIEMAPELQWVQIDLEKECEIYGILIWHYLMEARVYNDVIVQVSNDADFIDSTTLFNNDHDNTASELGLGAGKDKNYYETNNGKLIDGKATKARYIRLYSAGNNNSSYNHYVEVEVFGI
ncbi:MAG: discoidin domain-containing protein [Phycisphaerae bacterium]|nr:discoidin domain-containing protein [Phycisphaerae bacterium]